MRIGLYTWGSEGDVRPFVALGVALLRAGHDVQVGYVAIDGRDYGPMGAPFGLRARAVASGQIETARATGTAADEALAGKGHPLRQVHTVLAQLFDPAADAMWDDAQATVPGLDVVVAHLLHHPAASVALRERVPLVIVSPIPTLPTRALPPMGAPDLGPLNPLGWWLADQVGKGWFVPRVNTSRARAGVPLVKRMFPRPNPEVALGLTCVSPTLVPRPSDWEACQHVPGFFELPASELGWTMPSELEAFLRAGEPPLLMGFGSMLAIPGEQTRYAARTLIEAAVRLGRRALIQAPWEQLEDLPRSPLVHRLGRAPHALVLPHCAAMVHHGGAGTTHTACLAGKASVVVPFLGDQFFWASRLRALGVAPAPVPRRTLDASRLAAAIARLTHDAEARARRLGESMATEDGVGAAVSAIETLAR